MKQIVYKENWPQSWKDSYKYDLMEVYNETTCRGHAYAYTNRLKHILEIVQKIAKPHSKILDIAGAQGNISLLLAELNYDVTWNDIREELIDYINLKHERGKINFVPGNIFSLDFKEEFDIVLACEIIEHVAHPDSFLKKIKQFVKQEGYIIVTTPNGEYFRNFAPRFSDCKDSSMYESVQFGPDASGHIFLFWTDEIYLLAQKAGLSVAEIRFFTNPLTNGHIKLEILLKMTPRRWVDYFENLTYSLPFWIKKKICTHMAVLLTRHR